MKRVLIALAVLLAGLLLLNAGLSLARYVRTVEAAKISVRVTVPEAGEDPEPGADSGEASAETGEAPEFVPDPAALPPEEPEFVPDPAALPPEEPVFVPDPAALPPEPTD